MRKWIAAALVALAAVVSLEAWQVVTRHAGAVEIGRTLTLKPGQGLTIAAPALSVPTTRRWLRADGQWTGVGLADAASAVTTMLPIMSSSNTAWVTVVSASVTVEGGDDVIVSTDGVYSGARGLYAMRPQPGRINAQNQLYVIDPETGRRMLVGDMPSTFTTQYSAGGGILGPAPDGGVIALHGMTTMYTVDSGGDVWSFVLGDGVGEGPASAVGVVSTGFSNQSRVAGIAVVDDTLYILTALASVSGAAPATTAALRSAALPLTSTSTFSLVREYSLPMDTHTVSGNRIQGGCSPVGLTHDGSDFYTACSTDDDSASRMPRDNRLFRLSASGAVAVLVAELGTWTPEAIVYDDEIRMVSADGIFWGMLGFGRDRYQGLENRSANCMWRVARDMDTVMMATYSGLHRLKISAVDKPASDGTYTYAVQVRPETAGTTCEVPEISGGQPVPSMLVQAFYGS